MNMAETFEGARPVAQHCAELTWRGPRPEERAEHLSAWCGDLGTELAHELSQLLSGGKLQVSVAAPETLPGKDVFERIGPVAVNSLLRCGESDQTVLFSLDYATAIALTDCSFGGRGELPEEVPVQLPRSAGMLVEKVASMIAQVIVMTNGSAERAMGDVLVRSESVTRLKPFNAEADVSLFAVSIAIGDMAEWNALLAVASDRLDGLLPGMSASVASRLSPSLPSDGTKGAFAAMPMPLEAVLSEIDMSLEQLENLKPGDEITLSVSGDFPLRIGETEFARGTIGTCANRLALRVSRISGASPSQTVFEETGAAA